MLQSAHEDPLSASAASRHLIPDLPSAEELLPYLKRIDRVRWYSNFGPLVCEFEERLQSILSARDTFPDAGRIHLTTLVSGYHALEVALRLAGIGPEKKVLVPAITFSACPLAVLHTGAQALLVEVDATNWCLTPQIARAAAEHAQVDAVMPVAVYGVPLPAAEWDEFSVDTGIPVIIDAAAAIGTQHLPIRGLVAHSLHATKPFGVGEGGVLVARDPDAIAKGRIYTNFGMVDRIGRVDGANAKMSEYHAAVGLAQLDRWDAIRKTRARLLEIYLECLEPLAGFVSVHPAIDTAVVSCLMLMLKSPRAEAVLSGTRQAKISFHRTYLPPLYRHPYFGNLSVIDAHGVVLRGDADDARKAAHMPTCERLGASLVGVPFHPFMREADVMNVVNNLTATLCAHSTFHVCV
jgi:dTDP-4-amino-4,6-dideoxygalactose transaminase